jgi:pilus assembly protein CpaE
MLTAAIATSDPNSSAQLLASIEQSGLVGSIKTWTVPTEKMPDSAEQLPDIVFLDLSLYPETFFTFGAQLRRIRPATRIIACSATVPPSPQLLLEAMRSGVQDFLAKPVEPKALKEILSRIVQECEQSDRPSFNKLIVIMGSKGGVGSTTVAVNLGVKIATYAKKRAAVLDFARPLGNVHLLLDLQPHFGLRDAIENLDRLDSHFFAGLTTRHKTGLEILGGASQPEEWQAIATPPLERVVNVAQSVFDIVLVDLGTQFSSEWSTILRMAQTILVVAEANVPSLWALERRLMALTGFGIEPDRAKVVVNRWHKNDEEALKSIQKEIRRPIFACLPNDYRKASLAINLGMPFMENHNNLLNHRYREIASQLAGIPEQPVAKRSGLDLFSFSLKRA